MGLAGLEGEAVVGGVDGFDADEVLPGVFSQVRERRRHDRPGVPGDGGVGAAFGDVDIAVVAGVVDGEG